MSRLGRQVEEATVALQSIGAPFALIGGLALAPHKVVRATQDVDLLVDAVRADDVEQLFMALGYRRLHRSDDAANYTRGDERLDLIYARRPIARRLLASAREITTSFGVIPVVSAEGLIALKLQAVTNDPTRDQDLVDIRALVRANRTSLDTSELREYFVLFGREALLDELLREAV